MVKALSINIYFNTVYDFIVFVFLYCCGKSALRGGMESLKEV